VSRTPSTDISQRDVLPRDALQQGVPAVKNRMDVAYAERYAALWNQHWWWRARRTFIEREITRLSRKNKLDRILDIGCGDGLFFDFLERFGAVNGIESDARIVTNPARSSQIEVLDFDGTYASDQRYDLILMLDVLEHIEHDREALQKVFELLKPGGMVVLTVPALMRLWSEHDVMNGHFRRYSRKPLVDLLMSEGFDVVKRRYLFFWAVLPMFARKLLYPAKANAGKSQYEVQVGNRVVSRIVEGLSVAEHSIGNYVPLPVGTSCFAIGQKPFSSELRRSKPR